MASTALARAPPAEVPTEITRRRAAAVFGSASKRPSMAFRASSTSCPNSKVVSDLRMPAGSTGLKLSAPMPRLPMYASRSNTVTASARTPRWDIQASISRLPKRSGSASANSPGRPRNADGSRSGKRCKRGPSVGMVSGASSMPRRHHAGSYSKSTALLRLSKAAAPTR
ncbi:MAG: hypothetical protein MUE46_00440 [Xanthomonadales bacterium]|jgi:hypothetical protein|nr:hypothetical protein [Xanthomonadales bacterium]